VKSPVNGSDDEKSEKNDKDADIPSPDFEPVSPQKPRRQNGKYLCSDCDHKTASLKDFKFHRVKNHNVGNVTICSCGFVFFTDDHYSSHMNLVSNEKNKTKLKKIVQMKKNEDPTLKKYKWIHDDTVRAPKPDNAQHV
jgi:hypothetical protein